MSEFSTDCTQASIQARTASLEAEVAAKRAKVDEITKQLTYVLFHIEARIMGLLYHKANQTRV